MYACFRPGIATAIKQPLPPALDTKFISSAGTPATGPHVFRHNVEPEGQVFDVDRTLAVIGVEFSWLRNRVDSEGHAGWRHACFKWSGCIAI